MRKIKSKGMKVINVLRKFKEEIKGRGKKVLEMRKEREIEAERKLS